MVCHLLIAGFAFSRHWLLLRRVGHCLHHQRHSGFAVRSLLTAKVRADVQIANDLLTLMQNFVKAQPVFQTLPFYIFCESYGGKV